MPHCWKSRVADHFFKNKVMIIIFLKLANDIMLLMVMEMRMSDWTDFVWVISVCLKLTCSTNLEANFILCSSLVHTKILHPAQELMNKGMYLFSCFLSPADFFPQSKFSK